MPRMCGKVSADTLHTLFSEEETQRDLAKHLQPVVAHRLVCYRFQVELLVDRRLRGYEMDVWIYPDSDMVGLSLRGEVHSL